MDRLEANRNYDCFCGNGIATEFVAGYLLEKNNLGLTDPAPFKVAIISDRQVSGYYYNEFENQFILRNIHPRLIACDAQEASKSLKTVSEIVADLRDQELGAQDWIIALGGGGVIDCASFAASVYSGRCNLILVPTTLGSMAESTVAEMAYLNSGKYKDAAFIKAEPTAVFADPKFLSTVPGKYKSNGYAPIIRLALLADPTLVTGLTDKSDLREFLNRIYAARTAVEIKNPRLLTLGNEIAAAIEGYFRFMNYSEGEALALSLYSCIPDVLRSPLAAVYSKLGLPVTLQGVGRDMILKSLRENLRQAGSNTVNVVDYDAAERGKWVIRNLTANEAMELFASRLDVIVPKG